MSGAVAVGVGVGVGVGEGSEGELVECEPPQELRIRAQDNAMRGCFTGEPLVVLRRCFDF
jgi:hypothetical protein